MKLRQFAVACAVGAGSASASVALASDMPPVGDQVIPAAIAKYVDEDKELLAYKSVSDGDGGTTAAIILRYPKAPAPNRAFSYIDKAGYSCELILFQEANGKVRPTGRSRTVVDCELNEINLVSTRLELNDQVDLSPKKVTFVNENIAGGSQSYSFEASDGAWHLTSAISIYRVLEEGVDEVRYAREVATYPKDFAFIPIEKFDRMKIRDALSKNRSIDP